MGAPRVSQRIHHYARYLPPYCRRLRLRRERLRGGQQVRYPGFQIYPGRHCSRLRGSRQECRAHRDRERVFLETHTANRRNRVRPSTRHRWMGAPLRRRWKFPKSWKKKISSVKKWAKHIKARVAKRVKKTKAFKKMNAKAKAKTKKLFGKVKKTLAKLWARIKKVKKAKKAKAKKAWKAFKAKRKAEHKAVHRWYAMFAHKKLPKEVAAKKGKANKKAKAAHKNLVKKVVSGKSTKHAKKHAAHNAKI